MCPLKTYYWKESRRRFLEEQREEERKLREKKREVQRKYDIYQRSVDRCIAEGRDFTPLSIIWHEHWLDGFEGDVVFPAVEELPFEDDNVLSDDDSSLLLIDEFPITKEEQIDIVVKMEDANDTVFVSEVVKNNEALVVDEIVHVDEAFVAGHVESVVEPEEVLDTPAEVIDLSLLVHDTCNELVSISRESNSFIGAVEHEARSATSLEHLKDIRAAHIYHDPFLVHCRPFDFVVADFYVVPVRLYKRLVTQVFTYLLFLDVLHYEGLLTYVRPRLLFDPGGFEDESFPTGRE